ncbi:MAG: CAP domain-containing protein [Cocleimonas sp.]
MFFLKSNSRLICLNIFLVVLLSACGGGNKISNHSDIQTSTNTENIENSESDDNEPVVATPTPALVIDADTTSPITEMDNIIPIIKLNGHSLFEVVEGSIYNDAGATATDSQDGNITANIIIAGDSVNTNATPGTTFTITYNVSDAAGNTAIEVTRSVSIIANPNDAHQIPALTEAEIINYLTIINNARSVATNCGGTGTFPAVPAVTWSDKLYKAAYEHSQDLSESDTFSHDGSGTVSDWSGFALKKKSTMADRVATYGYSWSWLSENISAGTTRDNPQQAVDSWLASSGHCQNIMSANVTEVGMAVSTNHNSKFSHYWTQNFSNPR